MYQPHCEILYDLGLKLMSAYRYHDHLLEDRTNGALRGASQAIIVAHQRLAEHRVTCPMCRQTPSCDLSHARTMTYQGVAA